MDVVDVSSSVSVLSVSLLQQRLSSDLVTPTLPNWYPDTRLDSMMYEHLEVDQSDGAVEGVILPATSELSASFNGYDCEEGASRFNIVGSAMCVLRRSVISEVTGTSGRVSSAAGSSGRVSENALQSAIKSTVKVLLTGIADRNNKQISSSTAASLDSVTLPYVSVGIGRGEVGSVWWDTLR